MSFLERERQLLAEQNQFVPGKKSWLKKNKMSEFGEIHVCLLCSMEDVGSRVSPESNSFYSSIILKKGITGYYFGIDLSNRISVMKDIEDYLEHGDAFPSFGYGGAEALYYRKSGNIPNSVFPIFWWRHAKGKNMYRPIFCI
eukprot:TRINITY_DN198978_c0_g1_i1.p1 TRINITY_DN198978_c0_g1~~TRINITY_DN198978_c0_g1_i1.p1  ORF type:complete len:142 (-),score=6.44 TRINITY_DN198978_c0_g1_i1:69-494(-)